MEASKLSEIEPEKMQINILLNEYQACHRNRNHYDSVRWTIGSIFIGASLTLFGISIVKEVETFGVIIACFFSLGLIMIWYLYSQHVNPYIVASIIRLQRIEEEISRLINKSNQKHEMKIHTLIRSLDHKSKYTTNQNGENNVFNIKGTKITFSLVFLVMGIWSSRVIITVLSFNNFIEIIWLILVIVCTFILPFALFWHYHNKFNQEIFKKISRKHNQLK